jgi:hypothetical protein
MRPDAKDIGWESPGCGAQDQLEGIFGVDFHSRVFGRRIGHRRGDC